jgi:outer membrane lipoprotein-sorting protein
MSFFYLAFLSFFIFTANSYANDEKSQKYEKESLSDAITPSQKVENFFNKLKTFEAQFIQTDDSNITYEGFFSLDRPDKVCLKYKKEPPLNIVVKNGQITYYDKKRDQTSYIPVGNTIVSLLLKRVFSFSDSDVELISQKETDKDIEIKFRKKDNPEEGTFVLSFEKKSSEVLDLRRVTVIDPSENKVTLNMISTNYDKKIKDCLFEIDKKSQVSRKFKE